MINHSISYIRFNSPQLIYLNNYDSYINIQITNFLEFTSNLILIKNSLTNLY